MTSLLTWLSRVTAVLILLLLTAGAYFLGVMPTIAGYREDAAALAEVQELLAKFQRVAASEEGLEEKLQEIQQRQELQGYYLTQETEALAAADLQARVKAVVKESGGTIRSLQTLSEEVEGDFRRVTLRMQMMTTTESLFRIVYVLETSQPFLFLDNVDIQSRSTRLAGQQENAEPSLTVSFDLYGYRPPGDP